MKELLIIQEKLKAPKNQYNSFGKYNYRSSEDILEGVKPLLKETECVLLISDEIININDRFYVKATVKLINKEGKELSATGYAREEESKKGMDGSQVTGASSSYARKYALNGLFAIDDGKDSDSSTPEHGKEEKKDFSDKKWLNYDDFLEIIDCGNTTGEQIKKIIAEDGYSVSKAGGEAIKYYLETGDVGKDLKNLFFKK